jgi:hypothetical protein
MFFFFFSPFFLDMHMLKCTELYSTYLCVRVRFFFFSFALRNIHSGRFDELEVNVLREYWDLRRWEKKRPRDRKLE